MDSDCGAGEAGKTVVGAWEAGGAVDATTGVAFAGVGGTAGGEAGAACVWGATLADAGTMTGAGVFAGVGTDVIGVCG